MNITPEQLNAKRKRDMERKADAKVAYMKEKITEKAIDRANAMRGDAANRVYGMATGEPSNLGAKSGASLKKPENIDRTDTIEEGEITMEELLKYMQENGIQDDIDNKRRDYTKGPKMNEILLNIIKTGEIDLAENGENENVNVNTLMKLLEYYPTSAFTIAKHRITFRK